MPVLVPNLLPAVHLFPCLHKNFVVIVVEWFRWGFYGFVTNMLGFPTMRVALTLLGW